jgi:hypothetical protein
MLTSELLAPSADLQNVAQGGRTIRAPETSEAVGLIQEALLEVGSQLPLFGTDENFGNETGLAVTAFKQSRNLSPSDPVVGVGTINRLDFELNYLEGATTEAHMKDTGLLVRDPFLAGILDLQRPDIGIGRRIIDLLELGDRICFRLSFFFGAEVSAIVGKMVEPFVFADYCKNVAPCSPADFFDSFSSSTEYVDFLLREHPTLDPVKIGALGGRKRPDILRHRSAKSEWDEVKPFSISGMRDGRRKLKEIPPSYEQAGLPYKPGETYRPTEFIPILEFVTFHGETIRVVLHLMRTRALIYWELCFEGDWVTFFNRVRTAAGFAAILIIAAEALVAGEIAVEIVAAVRAVMAALGIAIPNILPE